MLPLHDYQRRAIRFGKAFKNVYFAIDIGMGKTRIALEIVKPLPLHSVVLAPLRVCYKVWPPEIDKWTPDVEFEILHGPEKTSRLWNSQADIYIINYDGLKWFFQEMVHNPKRFRRFNLILDEASFVKSWSTVRFRILKKMFPMYSDYRFALSATPAPGTYLNLWSQYYLLDKGKRLETGITKYKKQYFWDLGPPTYKIHERPDAKEIIQEKISDITFRLDADDYLKLPPYVYTHIKLDLPPKLRKQYATLEKEFFIELSDVTVEAMNAAVLQIKLRQFLQGALYYDKDYNFKIIHTLKVKALRELYEGLAGQPILAPIWFRFELQLMKKEFGDIPCIVGGQSGNQRAIDATNRTISDWNAGKIPLLLCHPGAVGHGLNMQESGHNIAWVAPTWSAEQYLQLNGRLRRQGQKADVVNVNHIVFTNTIDEYIVSQIKKRNITQAKLLEAIKQYGMKKGYYDD